MARTSRTREQSLLALSGTKNGTWNNVDVSNSAQISSKHYCEDQKGRPVTSGPLRIEHTDLSNCKGWDGSVDVTVPGFISRVTYKTYPFDWTRGSLFHVDLSLPSPASLIPTLLSRTNPSRPVLVPLTLIQDVVELPKMLRDVGKLIRTPRRLLNPKQAANAYLGAKFGWLPLIHDVHQILNVGEYINARKKELDRLYSEGGLRRRLQLGGASAAEKTFSLLITDHGFTVSGFISKATTAKTWGTVRWKPDSPFQKHNPTDAEKFQLARQLVLGLTTEGLVKGAWDVLPWTWLVDWFSNAGDWLTQYSSTVRASPQNVCIMRETNTVYQHTIASGGSAVTDHGNVGIRTTKSRYTGSGSLSASLPPFDVGRLSVLGALFVQRFK